MFVKKVHVRCLICWWVSIVSTSWKQAKIWCRDDDGGRHSTGEVRWKVISRFKNENDTHSVYETMLTVDAFVSGRRLTTVKLFPGSRCCM